MFGEMLNCRAHRFHRFDGCPKKSMAAWEREVRSLPALNRGNHKDWWKAAEPLFHSLYGSGGDGWDFEDQEEFARYSKSAAYKDKSHARALIRRDIKRNIKQAFRSIAPKKGNKA